MLNPYSAGKSWVCSFTMSLAKEYRDSGVGIYLFQPGVVKSDMMGHMVFIDGFEDQLLKVFRVVVHLFAKAGAVVAESGGILSHSSVIAREYNIPAVVSVDGALQLPDMAQITVDGFKGEVLIHEALPLELQPIPEQASDPENIN